MVKVEELVSVTRKRFNDVRRLETDKLGFLPEVVVVLEDCLRLVEPDSADIDVGGWLCEDDDPTRLYGTVRLYFHNKPSMQASAAVLEALDTLFSIDNWSSRDEGASLTRVFTQTLGNPPRDIDIHVYWSVVDAPESGCFKRLVRVERKTTESEHSVYEIVCKEVTA